MNKTLKQIADELGIDKQKVYRYVKKNHIKEAVQDAQVKWYDETAQEHIKSGIKKSKPHQRATSEPLYDALLKQLEIKDKQIEALQKALDQEQQLHALSKQKILALEKKEEDPQSEPAQQKRHWWNFRKE